jgi:hypothetical protein
MQVKWAWEFVDCGGYDCMSDAVYVKCDGETKVTLDLHCFGQRDCQPAPVVGRAEAEALAEKIVKALNA